MKEIIQASVEILESEELKTKGKAESELTENGLEDAV